MEAVRKLIPEQYLQEPAAGWSSVRATLVHLADATVIWARLRRGETITARATEDEVPTLGAAARLLDRGHDAFNQLLPTLTPERVAAV